MTRQSLAPLTVIRLKQLASISRNFSFIITITPDAAELSSHDDDHKSNTTILCEPSCSSIAIFKTILIYHIRVAARF